MQQRPLRSPWEPDFPPVLIQAPRLEVSTHPWFGAARTGDVDAAALLVADLLTGEVIERLAGWGSGPPPLLAAVHAQKHAGLNVLGEVLALGLHLVLGWDTDTQLVQANIVDHSGDIGFNHLARQAVFDGAVEPGRVYVLVDDFIGQGGTIANLRGHIVRNGGVVRGATVLSGNSSAARLVPDPATLRELGDKHASIADWWEQNFGFGFDCLTAAEAGFLAGNSDPEYIRSQVEAAWRA
jgi:hypothetical protein